MKFLIKGHQIVLLTTILVFSLATIGFSSDEVNTTEMTQAKVDEVLKSDKSGTNPINFTHDIRFYNEYMWLDTPGDSVQNVTTIEYRQPFASNKWQFRTRIRGVGIDIDEGPDAEYKDWGLGEVDFRVLTVPWMDMKSLQAFAYGLETFLPTAEDGLGSQRLTFGPQVFYGKFNPFGAKGWMFAPGYQHRISVWEDDDVDMMNQSVIDLYIVGITSSKQYWLLIDPQIILDWEQDENYMILDVEVGMMLDRITGSKGHSIYLRPSVGVGGDAPTDGSIEIGYKVVW